MAWNLVTKRRKKLMTIDFESIYKALAAEAVANQKKLDIDSSLGVFYGISPEGYFRLAFMSSIAAPKMESTRLLRVTQGKEKEGVFWTCFDLLNMDAKKVFYTFCTNLIESIVSIKDEVTALKQLKVRYVTWKAMFKNEITKAIPKEKVQGLFGEMYYLKQVMFPQYGVNDSIKAWSGPDGKSKDFSIGTMWYEIKTVGANATTVKISSLTQLSSENTGSLVIIKAEGMSEEFSNGNSSIEELFKGIMIQIDDYDIQQIFLNKFCSCGVDLSDECLDLKFDVKSIRHYKVNEDFPKITEKTAPYTEIVGVTYELSISAIEKYAED